MFPGHFSVVMPHKCKEFIWFVGFFGVVWMVLFMIFQHIYMLKHTSDKKHAFAFILGQNLVCAGDILRYVVGYFFNQPTS